jgi:hypothetical protein
MPIPVPLALFIPADFSIFDAVEMLLVLIVDDALPTNDIISVRRTW